MSKTSKNNIFLTTMHHSDLTWQYSYEKYDEIREEQLNLVMGFFKKYPEYGFLLDQAYMLENYIARNPEKKIEVEQYFNKGEGSLELFGAYSIPDINLCSGESFVRNCILGQEYYEKEWGYKTEVASMADAFGMPMQVPQVLSKLGYKYLIPGRTPNARDGLNPDKSFIWKGKGNTDITVVVNEAGVDKTAYITNVPVLENEEERFVNTLTKLQNIEENVLAYYQTEVQLLDEAFFKYLQEINDKPNAPRKVTFGKFLDFCKTINLDALPIYNGEFNPTLTGCYTTRIDVKQKIRRAEEAMYVAELIGAITATNLDLTETWKNLSLGQFHDASCGCHHDICNIDVHKKLDFVLNSANKTLDTLLSRGNGDKLYILNPSSTSTAQLVKTNANALPNDIPVQQDGEDYYYVSSFAPNGITRLALSKNDNVAITTKVNKKNYKGETDFYIFDFSDVFPKITSKKPQFNVFGNESFGELLFRHESGSMWTETLAEPNFGRDYQEETVVSVEEGPVFIKVTTNGKVKPGRIPISGNSGDYWTGFESLSFKKEYIFPIKLPYFSLRLTVNFKGYNTKLSLRVPVKLNPLKATALYDTPFAAVARKPYFEVPQAYKDTMQALARPGDYTHARGDYPALHWVDYSDDTIGITVANSGTPGHQLVGKDILISLLRSGTRCQDGTMYPQPGAYNNGTTVFEFAFSDHTSENTASAIHIGDILNRKPISFVSKTALSEGSIASFDNSSIVISSIYRCNNKLIVRAYECFGNNEVSSLSCGKLKCYSATMRGEILVEENSSAITFTPHEIKTFVLK